MIDADGHTMEFMPLVLDYIKDIGGTGAVHGFNQAMTRYGRWFDMSLEERRDTWTWIPPAGNDTPPPHFPVANERPSTGRNAMPIL